MPFKKGHKFYKGGEKGWIKKGRHFSVQTEFKKGHTPVMKGKHQTAETVEKNRLSHIGKPSKTKGRHWKMKEEKRKNMSRGKGKDNHCWLGGLSKNPYPSEFTPELKLKIRTRDNFTCQLCGRTEREELEELNRVLCVNHINFDKNDCREKNLNTLCLRCNVKINREREYWINYFNNIHIQING